MCSLTLFYLNNVFLHPICQCHNVIANRGFESVQKYLHRSFMWDYHANQIMLENKKHDCNHNQIIEQDRRSTAPNLGIVLGKSGKKKPHKVWNISASKAFQTSGIISKILRFKGYLLIAVLTNVTLVRSILCWLSCRHNYGWPQEAQKNLQKQSPLCWFFSAGKNKLQLVN